MLLPALCLVLFLYVCLKLPANKEPFAFHILGFLVFYTTDNSQKDRDWVVEGVLGDRLSVTIKDLSLETTYYFKVQARNNIGYGPTSPTIVFRTPRSECAHSSIC